MASYQDKKKNEWQVELDVVLLKKIRDLHRIELGKLEVDPLLSLRADPEKLVCVMQILCQDQIDQKQLTDADFRKAANPDSMLAALKEAIIDFFPFGQASHATEGLASYDRPAGMVPHLCQQAGEQAERESLSRPGSLQLA